MDRLQELYRQKGEAQTQVEIWTGRLREINLRIGDAIAKGDKPDPEKKGDGIKVV